MLKKDKTKRLTKKTFKFKFKSKVFIWVSPNSYSKDHSGAWRFARVPENISLKIKNLQKGKSRRGWGAVYVKAKIKKSEWTTSIFPDRHYALYLLPLKKEIRYEENLYDGININVTIEIWF